MGILRVSCNLFCLIFIGITSCTSQKTVDPYLLQTLVQATIQSIPTFTPSPTFTPPPTETSIPTPTATSQPSITAMISQKNKCKPEFQMIDIVANTGKGVFVKITCQEDNPDEVLSISIILPTGTTKNMENAALQYVLITAPLYDWSTDDIDKVYQRIIEKCDLEIVFSGHIFGFCQTVGQESKVIAFGYQK